MAQKVMVRPEQVYACGTSDDEVLIAGKGYRELPWNHFAGSKLYALTEADLEVLLAQAVRGGYQVMEGYQSPRRGLRGFSVGLGAWGHAGRVECRSLDCWAVDLDDVVSDTGAVSVEDQVQAAHDRLREIVVRLNEERTPFRSSAFRWLGALYERLAMPYEPEGRPEVLPAEVAALCRHAHVGGPIVHARTQIEPYVSLDRGRAFGQAMLEPLPCGDPADLPVHGDGLSRWRPNDLMRATGVAVATVRVFPGPLVPLLPVLKPRPSFDRTRVVYPVGQFSGVWCLHELAALESSGRGQVEKISRVVTFQSVPVFAGIIRYLRKICQDLPVSEKRLEHMLYGKCARGLGMVRLGMGPSGRRSVPSDLLDDRFLGRMTGRIDMRPCAVKKWAGPDKSGHPLMRVSGYLNMRAEWGSMDRPDRSAWITSSNRVAMGRIIESLDTILGVGRSGEYIGRIYVDGMDIQCRDDQLGDFDLAEVRRCGSSASIYRSGAVVADLDDGTVEVEGSGLVPRGSSVNDLLAALQHAPDPDGGLFAGGRVWITGENADGSPRPRGTDPRLVPGAYSEPPELGQLTLDAMGYGAVDTSNATSSAM